jgi:hypothetical protein
MHSKTKNVLLIIQKYFSINLDHSSSLFLVAKAEKKSVSMSNGDRENDDEDQINRFAIINQVQKIK